MLPKHWRNGLSGASNKERAVLIDAERRAREKAFGEAYQARCDAAGSLLVDARDLSVRSTRVVWGRADGCLWVRVFVYLGDDRAVRICQYRASRMPRRGVDGLTQVN
jgi:hypothetical protein